MGILTFLTIYSAITPVFANDWGAPLATDDTGDGSLKGEDILSVDARYFNGFVDFRFIMNDSLYKYNFYDAYIDLDKNSSTGDNTLDIGCDLTISLWLVSFNPFIHAQLSLNPYSHPIINICYNMTANNGTAHIWSDPSALLNFHIYPLINGSQGEVVFGVNWTWAIQLMASYGITWDGSSIYLVFHAGTDTDYCPNQTPAPDEYIEWNPSESGGIPGFELSFVILFIFVLGAFYILKKKSFQI